MLLALGIGVYARFQQLSAQSSRLAVQAEQVLSNDRPAALGRAIAASEMKRTPEALRAVAHAFPRLQHGLEGLPEQFLGTAFSPDGQRVVVAGAQASSEKTGQSWWNEVDATYLAMLQGQFGKNWKQEIAASPFRTTSFAWLSTQRTMPRDC
jgi:hypothetical protein